MARGLASRFKGSTHIKAGGVHCPCCNPYKGKEKALPGRAERRRARQADPADGSDLDPRHDCMRPHPCSCVDCTETYD